MKEMGENGYEKEETKKKNEGFVEGEREKRDTERGREW